MTNSLRATQSALDVLASVVRVALQATGPVDRGLQLHDGAARPAARSGGKFHGLDRSEPMLLHRREQPPRARFLPVPAAIGRVAGSPNGSGAAEDHGRRSERLLRPGGATDERRSRRRRTRQHRLPSSRPVRGRFASIRIALEMLLAGVSGSNSGGPARRARSGAPLISSYILARRLPEPAKNDPRETAISGGLVTTDRTGYGDV